MGVIQEVAEVSFDSMKNRLIIILANGDKIEVEPLEVMKVMPKMTDEEKVEDLKMMMHYIDRQDLSQLSEILDKVRQYIDGIASAREELKKCTKLVCVKKWQSVSKTYLDQKNSMKELRLTVKLFDEKKKELRTKIAQLGFDPDEEVKKI